MIAAEVWRLRCRVSPVLFRKGGLGSVLVAVGRCLRGWLVGCASDLQLNTEGI
jgi:hypothetical protein